MKMENYEACVGFELCETPLSSVAQKIMSAMHSGDLVDSKNWGESTKTVDVTNKSSARYSVLLEGGRDRSLEGRNPKSLTSQASRGSIRLSPQSSRARLRGQLSADQKQKSISPLALSSYLIPQYNEEASVLQRTENKRKHFLKEITNKENKESMNLKRKCVTYGNLSEKASKHLASEEEANKVEAYLTSGDSGHICDIRYLDDLAKSQLTEALKQTAALVVTLMYKDGSTQLRADQAPTSCVRGIVMLLKSQVEAGSSWSLAEGFKQEDRCIYIHTEHACLRGQEQEAHRIFARNVLFQTLKCKCPVICFNAKDFVRTVLQFFDDDGSWRHVADFVGLDPRIAAWLIDPSDTAPSFEDLVAKHLEKSVTVEVSSTYGNSSRNNVYQNVRVNLSILYRLTKDLCSKLKANGLWQLFCTLELPLIPVLAVMENHKIQVNKEEMERISALLGAHLKKLEQEAHFVAGEQFLIMSNNQLREILFGKLKLHLLGPRKSLPGPGLQQYPSTSEAVLNSLQDLHPLPKIILEYRQVHKTKSTFVDGLLACMKQGSISSTWNQTGTVTGRLSAKHPIELRILAHLSGDPELLKLFQESERDDVFSTLTSQWKNISIEHVTPADREQTKKVVYSVVYGAGKERLAACLGVTVQEATQFLESFLQKYKKIKDFAQATIAQCHRTGYVASILGRRRPLPRIHARNPELRAQAERQAVNFVVQGSAADLCKMAMIRIFAAVTTSTTLTARLVAQIHDELLFEVEDSQVPEFAVLVRRAMESLQRLWSPELQLQVPLKVSLSAGRSWGCLAPLQEALPRGSSESHESESPGCDGCPPPGLLSTYPRPVHFSPSFLSVAPGNSGRRELASTSPLCGLSRSPRTVWELQEGHRAGSA